LSSNFHLFIALAILEKHRNVIMDHLKGFDEVLKYVNELSNTMDLDSTIVRAEALFRRFQRTVEAIDKKHNFPTPSVRQRRPTDQSKGPPPAAAVTAAASSSSSSSRDDRGGQSVGPSAVQEIGADKEKEKVISPELRDLLSRKIAKLDKTEVKEHGGGVGNPAAQTGD